VGHFVSVGGVPVYRGYMNALACEPVGMPVPTREDGARVTDPALDEKGFRVARTEELVFEAQPDATHFRYPWVYGPRQPAPREWSIVRRILDARPHIILADGGLSLSHFGYVENLAHALLLAVDQPEKARGRIYNCGDQQVLTLRQVVDTIAEALGHEWEVVSMPWEIATPARPLVAQPWTTHRVVSLGRIEAELGYRDRVAPREALARTARWLVENRPEPGGIEEQVLEDPFDYAAEDQLIERYRKALAGIAQPDWREGRPPGFGMAYSGPGGRPRSQPGFDERRDDDGRAPSGDGTTGA
jgi:nucleoside-diphosphate-sugar epimerase